MSETAAAPGDLRWLRVFAPIWIGQAASLIGSQIASFALVWWMTVTTGSATVLATATIATILPGIVLGPVIGAYVDRWDRKRVMIIADLASALAAGALGVLFLTGAIEVWHIYAAAFVRGIAGYFHLSAMRAATTLLVPPAQFTRVAGLNQMLAAAVGLLAPPLGALAVSIAPIHALMWLDVATALLAIAPLLFVIVPKPPARAEETHLLQDIREGFSFILAWRGMVLTTIVSVVLNFLLAPALALTPLLATKHFGGGALEIAYITAAMSVGLLVGGGLVAVMGGFKNRIAVSIWGVIAMGVAGLATAFAPPGYFYVAIAGLVALGVANAFANAPMAAIFQTVVPPELQGRVLTLIYSLCAAGMPIGLAIAGPLTDWLGPQIWFQVGAIACIVMGAIEFSSRAIMTIENGPPAREEASIVKGGAGAGGPT